MWHRLKVFFNGLKFLFKINKIKSEQAEMIKKLYKLEHQVEKYDKQLEIAKTSFLNNIYHEIRTPLNAIMGFKNILAYEKEISPKEREEYLVMINQSSTEFLRVMDNIIQASLLEAGMEKIKEDEFELKDLLDEVYVYFTTRKHLLKKTRIAFLKNVPGSVNKLNIVCDKNRLFQLLSQLLDNAFKFTDKGIIEFGCNIKGQKLEFHVKDSGFGCLDGKESNLFCKFSKNDISGDCKNGLGLGLSICKKIVELMNGTIWYTPNEGKGTCFFFSIPLIYAESKNISKESSRNIMLEGVHRGQNIFAV